MHVAIHSLNRLYTTTGLRSTTTESTTESTSEPAQPVTVVQPSCVVDVKRLLERADTSDNYPLQKLVGQNTK